MELMFKCLLKLKARIRLIRGNETLLNIRCHLREVAGASEFMIMLYVHIIFVDCYNMISISYCGFIVEKIMAPILSM